MVNLPSEPIIIDLLTGIVSGAIIDVINGGEVIAPTEENLT